MLSTLIIFLTGLLITLRIFAEEVSFANTPNLFHLAWTTSADTFQCWRLYVILSIQRNYYNTDQYKILIHSNSLNDQVLARCPEYERIVSTNIQFWPINDQVFRDTPMYDWWAHHKEFHGDLTASVDDFRYSHLTDLVRFAVLWRFGGAYLDFDMLLLRPLTLFHNCFAAQKDENSELTKDDSDPYNFAVAKFEAKHPFLTEVMQNVSRVYNPSIWPCVGPRLITSMVHEWTLRGKVEFHKELPREAISNYTASVHVFPHPFFYPFYWKSGASLVQRNETSRKLYNQLVSTAVTLHIWSRSTNMSTIERGSTLNILMNHIREGSNLINRRKKTATKSKTRV